MRVRESAVLHAVGARCFGCACERARDAVINIRRRKCRRRVRGRYLDVSMCLAWP